MASKGWGLAGIPRSVGFSWGLIPGAGGWLSSSGSVAPLFPKQLYLGRSLSPFFLTCAAYFILWIPEDPPSWVGALVKCLPVLCLAGFLRACASGHYSSLLQVALLFSAFGDGFLIWPETFLYGERFEQGCVILFGLPLGGVWGVGATSRWHLP